MPCDLPATPAAPLPDIEDLNRAACARGATFYRDPITNLHVFTSAHLSTRPCCGCGCRHCPYRPSLAPAPPPRLLAGDLDALPGAVDVLFWSGGKDSFLALRSLQHRNCRPVVLLTTYDAASHIVAHQQVGIADVKRQANRLRLALLGVPLAYGEYLKSVHAALDKLRDNGIDIVRLAFGDLHLRHIRTWREEHLNGLRAELVYPLWMISYEKLLAELDRAGVVVRISAVDDTVLHGTVKVGDIFNHDLIHRLPKGVDAFGENGEFHTLVEVCDHQPGPDCAVEH